MSGIPVKQQQLPRIDQKLYGRYMKIPKANWAELYFDLMRAGCEGRISDEEIMRLAERRLDRMKPLREVPR